MKCQPITHLELKAQETRRVEMTLTSEEKGLITELDLSYRAFNCIMSQKLRLGVHVDFIDAVPTLSVVSVSPGDPKIELFNGQHHSLTLRLTNQSLTDITFLRLEARSAHFPFSVH